MGQVQHAQSGMNETVDAFVTALYVLTEYCSYGMLHDELIRDRPVVGLLDKRLSVRMQMDPDLTLERAINMARQMEEMKRQQSSLLGDTRSEASDIKSVDRVYKGSNKTASNKPLQTKPHCNTQTLKSGVPSVISVAALHLIQQVNAQLRKPNAHMWAKGCKGCMCVNHKRLCMRWKRTKMPCV